MATTATHLLTVKEAAKRMRTSPWMLYQRIVQGILQPGLVVRFGRSIRISEAELETFIRQGGRGNPPKRKAVGGVQ